MIEKSFVTQRFAKLKFPHFSLVGYSMAGEETVVQVPELNVCFDVGRAPQFCISSDYLCISHAHMDHLAGIGYYVSQKHFQGMKPGTIFIHEELEAPLERLLACWRTLERQQTPYEIVPMVPNRLHEIRRDFGIRALETHHAGPSLGYSLVSIREKLKPEYMGIAGEELARMKAEGTPIQYRLEVPLVTYLGDTTAGPVFEHPDVVNAEVLLMECTFFEPDHIARSKAGRHLHVEQLNRILSRLNNKHVVLLHVSRRTGIRRARHFLRKAVHEELLHNVLLLMDFDNARDAGELEAAPGEGA
jgi:ribonuclease Z